MHLKLPAIFLRQDICPFHTQPNTTFTISLKIWLVFSQATCTNTCFHENCDILIQTVELPVIKDI